MASTFSDIIFFLCAATIVASQWFILRSTARGMRYGAQHDGAGMGSSRRTTLEWLYAIVPACALAALLLFSWRAMHPEVVRVRGIAPTGIGAAQ